MATPDGYASTSWSSGYGDYVMKPDLDTIRPMPWVDGAAMVLCDVLDHDDHEPVPHSPRAVLKKQLARLEALGYSCTAATELEFFLFRDSYEEARDKDYRNLVPISPYNEDYHIFQTAKEEHVMRPIRNHLHAAGVPIEGSKGEGRVGAGGAQHPLHRRAAEWRTCTASASTPSRKSPWRTGAARRFLSKLHEDTVGSSSHVHQSLRDRDGGSAFLDPEAEHGMSTLMRQYLAGQLKYVPDMTFFFRPLHQLLQALRQGLLRADPDRVVDRQPGRRASASSHPTRRASGSSAASAARTPTPISPSPR